MDNLMNQTKYLLNNLIDQLDMDECLKYSFKNHHTQGLHYINLFRDKNLTIKLYFFIPGLLKHNNEGFLISPHKHAYNFSTEVIFGEVSHVLFNEVDYGDENSWYKYLYEHYRNPEDRLTLVKPTTLEIASNIIYGPGESYFVNTNETHSLILPEDKMTCLLLHQFAKTQKTGTDFYSTSIVSPSFDNVYEMFTENEIKELLEIVKKEIE